MSNEVISAWDVYWVMQLDSIVRLFSAAAVCGGTVSLLAICFVPLWMDDELVDARLRKWIITPPATLLVLGAIGSAFIPSTKTAAAMLILPAIANNETIQKEAGDLYGIAKEALREAVGGDEKDTKAK